MDSARTLPALWRYLTVAMLAYGSGSAVMPVNYGAKLAVVAVLIGVLLLRFGGERVIHASAATVVVAFVVATVIFVPLHTGDPDVGPYLTVSLHIVIGYLACHLLQPRLFREAYIWVMGVSATSSVAMHFVGQARPDLVSRLPVTMVTDDYYYYDAGIHVFLMSRAVGQEGFILSRNNGFAWEPGAYQVFLNLALLFVLDRVARSGVSRSDRLLTLVLVAGVLSTYSTGGYIILAVSSVLYWKSVLALLSGRSGGPSGLALVVTVGVVLVLTLVGRRASSSVMAEKFDREFSDGGEGAFERIALNRLEYVGTGVWEFLGIGFTAWDRTGESLWNSVIHAAVILGVPFTTALLAMYFNASRQFVHGLAFTALFVVAFATETLFWRMLFCYIAFSGLMYGQEVKSRMASRARLGYAPSRSPDGGVS